MAIQYNVYWSYVQGAGLGGTQILNVTSPYIHTGLTANVTYWYVVTAYDTTTLLESVASNEMSGTPLNVSTYMVDVIW